MNRTARVVVLTLMLQASAMASVNAYHVEPTKEMWSGKVLGQLPYGGVSEVMTVCFDSLASGGVQLFAGDTGHGSDYNLSIRTYPGAFVVATGAGAAVRPDQWVTFNDIQVTSPESVVKGKQLEFRFVRASGQDSIEYYYHDEDPYAYGVLKVGSDTVHGRDLVARVYGQMNPVSSSYWGVEPMLPWGYWGRWSC